MQRFQFRIPLLVILIGFSGELTVDVSAQTPRLRRLSPDVIKKIEGFEGKQYTLAELKGRGGQEPLRLLDAPLVFEKNVGQADSRFNYVLRGGDFAVGFEPSSVTAAVFQPSTGANGGDHPTKGHAIQLSFRGARPADITGEDAVGGAVRIARGAGDAAQWDVPAYNSIVHRGLYRGVDMVTVAKDGRLEYGFELKPGATLSAIRIGVRGVTALALDRSGNLEMRTPSGTIVQTRPRFAELGPQGRRDLKGRFVLYSDSEYGFAVDGHSSAARLVVDPEIVFTSYFGGTGNEGTVGVDGGANDLHGQGFDVALGSDGNIFVVGTTVSPDFPATAAGALQGSTDAFVLRLDPTLVPGQQIVYATFLGGTSFERGVSVSPREDGSVFVVGCTTSSNFPASSGVVDPAPTASVGYLARLAGDGSFDMGTRIGRTVDHHPASVVYSKRSTETEGFVYVGGSVAQPGTGGGDAVTGAFQPEHMGGGFDGFVAKFDVDLTRHEYLTYLGGTRRDLVMDLAVNDGFAFVTGSTTSFDFPVTELAVQPTHSQAGTAVDCADAGAFRQCFDAFVTRVGRSGATLIYSTYLGGDAEEFGRGLAIATGNQATLTGAARPTLGSATEIFVMRLEGGGENILWDERMDGNGRDHGEEVVVDGTGRAHVVGTISRDGLSTSETSFHGGAGDIFYSAHAAATGETQYFTYLGGSGDDRGFAVAAEGSSTENFCAFVVGSTTSEDVTTVQPLEGGDENRGGADLLLFALCEVSDIIVSGDFNKTVSPGSVASGQTVTFTITVRNGGDVSVPVTVTDTVPAAFTVTGVTGPGCSRSGNSVTCAFSAPSGATSILVTARAGDDCPRTVTNTATIQAGSQSLSSSATAQVTCPPPFCPNGVVNPGEECDSTPGCRANCTLARCGDGITDPGEECDDGNSSNNDNCTTQCRDQVIEGNTCSSGGPPCAGDLVCGRRCGVVEECTFFIFCDTYLLCSIPDECMPPDEATFTVGP
jgi:uncharacterized repeat protein (TIGR01451 family)